MSLPSSRSLRRVLHALAVHPRLNFLVTNRIPRRACTIAFGWFSRLQHPWIARPSLAIWTRFARDLDLSDARESDFPSLHACFTRTLTPGARPIDPSRDVLVSPCDAVVGTVGTLHGRRALQAKDETYRLEDLLEDASLAATLDGGTFVTLRLTATMYHHFHAPGDGHIAEVRYIAGDVWNVNPPAVRFVRQLFCRNERAVVPLQLHDSALTVVLVPVAAVLVASMRFAFVPAHFHLRYRGPQRLACDAFVRKGDRLGHFEHGSTIIVLAPPGVSLHPDVRTGMRIRMGAPLLRLDATDASDAADRGEAMRDRHSAQR